MDIIDLTHLIDENVSVYDKIEIPYISELTNVEKEGFKVSSIHMVSHTATHIDAPSHMIKNALNLESFDLEYFLGKATILNVSSGVIDIEQLKTIEVYLNEVNFLLINTGWSKFWGTPKYLMNYPALTEEAAKYLSNFKLRAVGVDTISVDRYDTKDFNVHKILFNQNMLPIENLTNLDKINKNIFDFISLPLKYKNSDGAPVRAIAQL